MWQYKGIHICVGKLYYFSFIVSPVLLLPDAGWIETSDLRDDEDPEVVCPTPAKTGQL